MTTYHNMQTIVLLLWILVRSFNPTNSFALTFRALQLIYFDIQKRGCLKTNHFDTTPIG